MYTEKQNNSTEYLNTIRALATIAVILIHISTPIVKMSFIKNIDFWFIGNMFDTAVRFAVPVFLMLSGATLLGKEYKMLDFYQKRLMRVLLPFLFWAPIYIVFSWFTMKHTTATPDFAYMQNWLAKLWDEKGISVHFWYIYLILVLYLFIPLINKGLQKLSEKQMLNILLVWVFANIFNMFIPLSFEKLPILSKGILYLRFAGYLILGYYLFKKDISPTKAKLLGWSSFTISWTIGIFGSYFLSMQKGKVDYLFYDYLGLCAMMQAAGIFLLCKNTEIRNKFMLWIRNTISDYSYGIYLVHIIVIGVFFINRFFWTIAHPLISVPVLVLSTLIVSFLIIYLLRKIPGGKHVAG